MDRLTVHAGYCYSGQMKHTAVARTHSVKDAKKAFLKTTPNKAGEKIVVNRELRRKMEREARKKK